jgi:hypothetical protein
MRTVTPIWQEMMDSNPSAGAVSDAPSIARIFSCFVDVPVPARLCIVVQ